VIKRNPKNAHAYFRRAFSLKALKEFGKAADDFEKAKNLDPLNPQLVLNHK
jgi:Tfp pilus assembly protein PilF